MINHGLSLTNFDKWSVVELTMTLFTNQIYAYKLIFIQQLVFVWLCTKDFEFPDFLNRYAKMMFKFV